MSRDLAVRRLAEFVFRAGDLYPPRAGKPVDAEEGVRVQQLIQKERAGARDGYRKEVALQLECVLLDQKTKLQGRADGVCKDSTSIRIEEYKCARVLPTEPDPVDMGQALLYAGLWAANCDDEFINVSVVYVVETQKGGSAFTEISFAQSLTRMRAMTLLAFVLACYEARMRRHRERTATRFAWSGRVAFPFVDYRPGQRAIARRSFIALKNRENLLLEAPTGSGKTMAVLFPAVRAQSEEEQLFFLTSRNSGARAALDAVAAIDPAAEHLVTVELTAKQKICFVEGMPCDADVCPYARGYFDRVRGAVDELLSGCCANREQIEKTARKHMVCPFELSLDAALWSDVVIGDYNYVFDPIVRLQRFNGHADLHLLIDEAHNLSPRAQDMLTVAIDRRSLRSAMLQAAGPLLKRLRSVDRALLEIRRALDQGEHEAAEIDSLQRALERLRQEAADHEFTNEQDALQTWMFDVHRWLASQQWYDEHTFAHIATIEARNVIVRRVCLDPAKYTAQIMANHGGIVRFSGTVSPLPVYQRLHGGPIEFSERGLSPFDAGQARVLIIRDIPTYYKSRHRSLPKLAGLVAKMLLSQPGRYLVALPSYAYLDQLAELLRTQPIPGFTLFAQAPGQTNEERDTTLQAFCDCERALFCIVLGGVFSESVDFSETSLAGVMLVGVGLPPPSLHRNLVAAYFDREQGTGWGQLAAYTQPAMSKIIQAAGRLIRSPKDRGVICLVDPRFSDPRLQQFFPTHWRPQQVTCDQIEQVLREFWQTPTIRTSFNTTPLLTNDSTEGQHPPNEDHLHDRAGDDQL